MTDEGAEVKYASTGSDALAVLRSTQCSLAILDVKMPDMDGFDVLEKIRGELGLTSLPVILLTALGGEADIIRGYDMGVDDYMLKPISESYLVEKVLGTLAT